MKLIKPVHFLDLRHKWWPRQEHGHFCLLSHWLEGPSCPGSPLSLWALGHSSQDTSLRCWPDPRCSLPHRRSSFPALLLVGCSEVPLAEWAFRIFSPATGMSAVPLAPHSNKREWSGKKFITSKKISMKLSYTVLELLALLQVKTKIFWGRERSSSPLTPHLHEMVEWV